MTGSVKVPAAPEVPHVFGSLTPFTDATTPNAPLGWCGGRGGAIKILVAVTVVSTAEPLAVTSAPTQTFANNASVTALSTNAVVVATLTTYNVPLCPVSVNEPDPPDVPHVLGSLTPFTDATTPDPCGP